MSIYKKFDDTLMYLANKSVEAWNFTTGRGKTDLANGMLTVAPILESTGFILLLKPEKPDALKSFLSFALSGVYFLISHDWQKRNKQTEKEEAVARERNAKVDLNKRGYEFNGTLWSLCGTVQLLPRINAYGMMVGVGNIIRGGSFYIMRADDLPPRKNCFKRAYDYIKEKLSEPIIIPEPAHVPILVRYSEECTRLNLNLSLGQIHSKKLEAMI